MQAKCDLQYRMSHGKASGIIDLFLWYSHGHSRGWSLFLPLLVAIKIIMLHSDPPVASVHLAKQSSHCMVNDNHILQRNACMAWGQS